MAGTEMTRGSRKMLRRWIKLGAMSVALSVCAAAWAHHSYATFDMSRRLLVKGTVKSFEWVNPHSWLRVIVPNAEGTSTTVWDIEAGPPHINVRHGWKPTDIHPGDKVECVIFPLRDGSPGGSLVSVTLPDGRLLRAR
jgi:hypothetical protein